MQSNSSSQSLRLIKTTNKITKIMIGNITTQHVATAKPISYSVPIKHTPRQPIKIIIYTGINTVAIWVPFSTLKYKRSTSTIPGKESADNIAETILSSLPPNIQNLEIAKINVTVAAKMGKNIHKTE
eukprot:TRINITY_DN4452_c0_g1_i1.p2 TRINITY_DN4452_c0_g1~~TRINITY_DN4452_c0_g1_i1.p2  ORF type:complete len:127 (+),score=6.54 TRINITY_DN4452_c0_g1_i1:78-458(+)